MYCMECGVEQKAGAQFCHACGASIGPPVPATETAAHHSPYAEIWPRLGALLLDALIVTLLSIIPAVIVGLLVYQAVEPSAFAHEEERQNAEGAAYFAAFSVGGLVWLVYHVAGWSGGQTWGMKALDLRMVVAEDDDLMRSPGFGRALVRYLVSIVSSWAIYIGYVWAFWDDRRQTWHDKAAGTVVKYSSGGTRPGRPAR